MRWKRERAALTMRFVDSAARALCLETLDRVLAPLWEAVDWVESADIRVLEPGLVEPAREALGALVRRPRAFTRRLKRSGEDDWYEDEVSEDEVRAELRACSTGTESADPESLPLRVVQAAAYLYRSLRRAARRGRGLAVFHVGVEE